MIMDKIGYPSILADDGQDAVEKADQSKLALIFMDIQMPRMNGYEAVQKLRSMGFTIPIIAVTASALSGEREHCMEVGFDDILVKPFKVADIEKMLYQWINHGIKALKETQQKQNGGNVQPREKTPPAKEIPQSIKQESAAVFDLQDALDTFMGDREVVKSLIEKFIEKVTEQIADIQKNIAEKDFETGRRNAHTIKGSSLTLAAKELGKAAAELEQAFKNEDMANIERLYLPLNTAFERFKQIVPSSGL
jgi:CheY-like chemotaxis protein